MISGRLSLRQFRLFNLQSGVSLLRSLVHFKDHDMLFSRIVDVFPHTSIYFALSTFMGAFLHARYVRLCSLVSYATHLARLFIFDSICFVNLHFLVLKPSAD